MSEEVPIWLRVLDIIIGLIMVILGIWVIWGIIFPAVLIGVALMQMLGIILVIWGIWNLVKGLLTKEMVMTYRNLLFIAALLLIIFGAIVFALPALGEAVIALLFTVGLIIYGVIILVVGFMDKDVKDWVRGGQIVLGFFLLILGVIFVFYLQTAATFLYFLLAIGLILAGFFRIIFGLSGENY